MNPTILTSVHARGGHTARAAPDRGAAEPVLRLPRQALDQLAGSPDLALELRQFFDNTTTTAFAGRLAEYCKPGCTVHTDHDAHFHVRGAWPAAGGYRVACDVEFVERAVTRTARHAFGSRIRRETVELAIDAATGTVHWRSPSPRPAPRAWGWSRRPG